MDYIPWVEKYRPTDFKNIVLENINKTMFKNMIELNSIPNLLFYGPPGTGKTTTIINLINNYQKKYKQKSKELIIHLNASDDRGIDVIRSNIQQFVQSNSLFKKGVKFVILDEVDYMTKSAQQALRTLMHKNIDNVRFCLICNYISRIEQSLQNECVRFRFSQLPKKKIIHFISKIVESENLNISKKQLSSLQEKYGSDIRSIINILQSNQNIKQVLDTKECNIIINKFKTISKEESKKLLYNTSLRFNISQMSIIKQIINQIYNTKLDKLNQNIINIFENIYHNSYNEHLVNYFILILKELDW